ncbi:MAG: hypothetical protein HRT68_15955 [Flavobacteriaceae bacterium]|nr:hypothetical protein [Flavobacteriaceae bacterium]
MQKNTKYTALIISILSASLINEFIVKYIKSYYQEHTYKSVAIGMLVTVVVFVPLFSFVGKWLNKASKSYIKTGKKVASNSRTGLWISFLIALVILFALFASIRHDLDVLNDIKSLF